MTIDSFDSRAFSVTMRRFITERLEEYAPGGFATSPANNNLFEFTVNDHPLNEFERKRFHTVVAKLLYLAKRICPDILVAFSFLCTRVTVATDRDDDKLAHVLKYLVVFASSMSPLPLAPPSPLPLSPSSATVPAAAAALFALVWSCPVDAN
jgi:hypothetical protein